MAAVGAGTRAEIAALAVFLALGGCGSSRVTGRPIRSEDVRAIAPGISTRDSVLERFGLPAAILGAHEIATVLTPESPAGTLRADRSYGFDSDTFFELFPPAGGNGNARRIYYHHHVESGSTVWFLLLATWSTGWTATDRLWTLVDERTGIVEDYAYQASGEKVVFGLPRTDPDR